MIKKIFFLSLLVNCTLFAKGGDDPLTEQDHVALELCHKQRSDAGYLAAKEALSTHESEDEAVLILKEAMVLCDVSVEYYDEYLTLVESVIRESSNPLNVGISWYQKARISYLRGNFKEALVFADISLATLKKAKRHALEGNVSYRDAFESFNHMIKRNSYHKLHNIKAYEEECDILKTYKWLDCPVK